MFSKFIKRIYLIFSPRTAPSIITVASKALLGLSLIQISAFLKTIFGEKYPNEATQSFAEKRDKMDFLQSFTFTQFLDKSGQVLAIDAALDLSKILINFGEGVRQKLKLNYDRKIAQNKLFEINEALKQKPSGNKKSARKLKSNLDELKSERDKIEHWLNKIEKPKISERTEKAKRASQTEEPESITQEIGSKVNNFNYVYMTYLLEFLASLYIMASLIEPLHHFLNRIWLSPEQYSLNINEMISEVKARYEFPSHPSPFTIFLNYVFSPKIAITVAFLQIILNQLDYRKRRNATTLLGNIPIIGLINSIGFKQNSITASYELSKYAAGSEDFYGTTLETLRIPDSAINQEYVFPFRDSLYQKALKFGHDKETARIMAENGASDHINKYLIDLTKFKNQKWFLVSIARYINIYGNFKFYKNIFHIIDNIFDLLDQETRELTHSDHSYSEQATESASSRGTQKLARRFRAAQSGIEKLSHESEEQQKLMSLKAVSYQPQGVLFPEETFKTKPKIKTRNPASNELKDDVSNKSQNFQKNSVSPEAERRKNEILSLYASCDKILFRTILKHSDNNINRTLSEQAIIKLADDLKLDCRRTESGYLIQVYKEFGASFHFSHGRDRSGTVNSAFISKFRQAFQAIGITIEDLDQIDLELDGAKCCQGDIMKVMAYVLTERPKISGRKFT